MTELTDVSGAFGYGDSILVGERVRLRGTRDDDLPALAKWSANEKDDVGFAIETLDDPPVLIGNIGLWGARPKDRCATLGIALGREHISRGYGSDAKVPAAPVPPVTAAPGGWHGPGPPGRQPAVISRMTGYTWVPSGRPAAQLLSAGPEYGRINRPEHSGR